LIYFIIVSTLFKNNYTIVIVFENIAFIFYIVSFFVLVLINPGIPKKEHYAYDYFLRIKSRLKDMQKCSKCNIIVPKSYKVIHCSICDICIIGQDHHNPIAGKCNGTKNIIYFSIFFIVR
jgi:hypothetical protein